MLPFMLILRGRVSKFNDGHHTFLSTQDPIHDMQYERQDVGCGMRDTRFGIPDTKNE